MATYITHISGVLISHFKHCQRPVIAAKSVYAFDNVILYPKLYFIRRFVIFTMTMKRLNRGVCSDSFDVAAIAFDRQSPSQNVLTLSAPGVGNETVIH